MAQSKDLYDAILTGNAKKATAATQAAIESGIEPMTLIAESMVPAMDQLVACSRRKNISSQNYFCQAAR